MVTFPRGLSMSFKKGVNVVFGGNYSGKTTIINSLRFGVFGLSWGHTVEGIEKRYFSSRVREIERKSLDINVVYRVKPMNVDVRRIVFSSGTAEIDAKVSKGLRKSLSKSFTRINRERQYYEALGGYMGLIHDEQMKLIPSLIFAEENRQHVLWKKSIEDLVLSLLTSSENAHRLRWIESQLAETKKDLDSLQQDKDRIIRKNSDSERIQKFLQDSLKKIEDMEMDKYAQQYNTISSELQECRNKSAQIDDALRVKLMKRADMLLQLSDNQKAILDLNAKSEQLEEGLFKEILNPSSPEECHLSRYLYYEKKCPFCLTDLSRDINLRIEGKTCLLCGQGALVDYKGNVKEIKQELSNLEASRKELSRSNSEIQKNIDRIYQEIERLTESKEAEHIRETALVSKINELKETEEVLHKKRVMSTELDEIKKQIENNRKRVIEIDGSTKSITAEIDKINELYDKTKTAMRTEIDLAVTKIKERFSSFVSLATNGEVSADLSPNFVPILNGRTIYYPEFASQFERTMMDYAFRIALFSVFAENTNTTPSLVIETPDEVTDESYIPYLAKAMLNFSSNLSIIVTTVNTKMMKQLLSNYKPSERKKRLTDLVSKGTITQRKLYQIPLSKYLSEGS